LLLAGSHPPGENKKNDLYQWPVSLLAP